MLPDELKSHAVIFHFYTDLLFNWSAAYSLISWISKIESSSIGNLGALFGSRIPPPLYAEISMVIPVFENDRILTATSGKIHACELRHL